MRKENHINCKGTITNIRLSHLRNEEKIYEVSLEVNRLSSEKDALTVLIPETMIDVDNLREGDYLYIEGELRSYNIPDGEKARLSLMIHPESIEKLEDLDIYDTASNNSIKLEGYICKIPNYRKTPLGREITDLFLAVNRKYNRCDYIPCICWGKCAREVKDYQIGQKLVVEGRLQSRYYNKYITNESGDINTEIREVREVSINNIMTIE